MKTTRAEKALPKNGPTKRVGSGGWLASFWEDKSKTPPAPGWYVTRRDNGELSWRAWGRGAWWKQIRGGWVEWFNGDGSAMTFDWMPRTQKSINLNSDQLPEVGDYFLSELQRSANTTVSNAEPTAPKQPGTR